jgi:hypothetical protein
MSSGSEYSQRHSIGTHDGGGEGRRQRTRRWYHPRPQKRGEPDLAGFNWADWLLIAADPLFYSVVAVVALVRRAERGVRTGHVSRT